MISYTSLSALKGSDIQKYIFSQHFHRFYSPEIEFQARLMHCLIFGRNARYKESRKVILMIHNVIFCFILSFIYIYIYI